MKPLPTLRSVLERVADSDAERAARIAADPLGLVRRYARPRDQEVVGLYCAAMAYGRVSLFLPILEELLRRLGPEPCRRSIELAHEDPGEALDLCAGLSYRMTRPRDLAELVRLTGAACDRRGGLEALFVAGDEGEEDLAPALARFRDALLDRAPRDIERGRRGLERHLPDVKKGSAAKRLWLYLRWMVREDAVDLGAWPRVSRARLLIPLDAHVFRFARALGLTSRKQPDLAAAREVTAHLRALDPGDPVRFDFNLCHLGMEDGCREKRYDPVCRPCALRPACVLYKRSWTKRGRPAAGRG
ncbi:MAG TPA: TIGR02757 family protein [Planctomycetota bacterium]|nr:TIGR02757 family protein [Planctomycetota bacterium]